MSASTGWFAGDGVRRPGVADALPLPSAGRLRQPEGYVVDEGLRDACNVALLLGQPLLLTGEPGTGKSRFAHALAWEFDLGAPLVHAVKSTSLARDLFYSYDALKRYQDIQSGLANADTPAARYLTINALGQAILTALGPAALPPVLSGLALASTPRRSVVLIDEIDKASRDFPNDVLNELEDMAFRLPELGDLEVKAPEERRPLVVLTSNSERDLPDAFLRRCVYYNIPFPDRWRLEEIVLRQLPEFAAESAVLRQAMELFLRLRDPANGLRKRPATAELLLWLLTLRRLLGEARWTAEADASAQRIPREVWLRSLSSLIKTAEDRERAEEVVNQWPTG